MFSRRILHHGSSPGGTAVAIDDRAVAGCWFELHRLGGCGAGEVLLADEFPERNTIGVGDWISCEATEGERWYLGRVEERVSASPAGVRLRLEGMGIELGEVFPGGFAEEADGRPPHRYAATDLFPHDPDWSIESLDSADSVIDVVELLLQQYVVPATHITLTPSLLETPLHPALLTSIKFRGEESVRAVVKDLALRAQASWGVNAEGEFFFLQRRSDIAVVWREGRDLVKLSESCDREHLFNRVLLTGDYIYDEPDSHEVVARRSYRWRGNYVQPASRADFGDRRIRLWVPWLRTEADTVGFVREFFRTYSQPARRYLVETTPQMSPPWPWGGRVRLEDRDGNELITAAIESVRELFDHAPRFRLELGPEDPRNLWPEPPHDERWELPQGRAPGGMIDVTDEPPLTSGELSSGESSGLSSEDSLGSSGESSDGSGGTSNSVEPPSSGGETDDSSSDDDSSGASTSEASSGFDTETSSDSDSGEWTSESTSDDSGTSSHITSDGGSTPDTSDSSSVVTSDGGSTPDLSGSSDSEDSDSWESSSVGSEDS
jgi:hypothetical protein